MGPMPLTEVKFIRTFLRDEPVDMTVEEVLKHATDPDFRLNLDVSGMEFMSIIRLLSHIGARMLQKDDSLHRKHRKKPLPDGLIVETLAELEADRPLYGGKQNFSRSRIQKGWLAGENSLPLSYRPRLRGIIRRPIGIVINTSL